MSRHDFCEICTAGGDPHEVHEATAVTVNGVESPVAGQLRTVLQVSYIDGHREPYLFIGGNDTEMTAAQAETLHRELGEQIHLMRAVQTTPAMAVNR